jgi:hypothetical protein
MDKYPSTFTTENLIQLKQQYQTNLKNQTRKKIYNTVIKNIKNGEEESIIEIPEKLLEINRVTICEELLDHFDNFEVEFHMKDTRVCGNYSLKQTWIKGKRPRTNMGKPITDIKRIKINH